MDTTNFIATFKDNPEVLFFVIPFMLFIAMIVYTIKEWNKPASMPGNKNDDFIPLVPPYNF